MDGIFGRRPYRVGRVTRLDPASGHQTQVLTTHTDWATSEVTQRSFDRWRIENFLRYGRAPALHLRCPPLLCRGRRRRHPKRPQPRQEGRQEDFRRSPGGPRR
ncbi:MAG: hypothetical protein M0T80_02170 [Actinomycetota bacterium]|nr:hypothetical protein [Actinomycetota bacterium]